MRDFASYFFIVYRPLIFYRKMLFFFNPDKWALRYKEEPGVTTTFVEIILATNILECGESSLFQFFLAGMVNHASPNFWRCGESIFL